MLDRLLFPPLLRIVAMKYEFLCALIGKKQDITSAFNITFFSSHLVRDPEELKGGGAVVRVEGSVSRATYIGAVGNV